MILREKVIELTPDRYWKSEYFLYDDMGEGEGPRMQILYLENKKTKTRSVEALNFDGEGGWDCDVWADDIQVLMEYLPEKISFNQFVGKLAIALELVPPDYDCSNATVHGLGDDGVPEAHRPLERYQADEDPPAWRGPILRQIVAALPEVKH